MEHKTSAAPACAAKARELRVAHNADDAKCAGVLRQIEAEVLTERIFALLEKALHESFVDNGNGLGGFVVAGGEVSPAESSVTPKF